MQNKYHTLLISSTEFNSDKVASQPMQLSKVTIDLHRQSGRANPLQLPKVIRTEKLLNAINTQTISNMVPKLLIVPEKRVINELFENGLKYLQIELKEKQNIVSKSLFQIVKDLKSLKKTNGEDTEVSQENVLNFPIIQVLKKYYRFHQQEKHFFSIIYENIRINPSDTFKTHHIGLNSMLVLLDAPKYLEKTNAKQGGPIQEQNQLNTQPKMEFEQSGSWEFGKEMDILQLNTPNFKKKAKTIISLVKESSKKYASQTDSIGSKDSPLKHLNITKIRRQESLFKVQTKNEEQNQQMKLDDEITQSELIKIREQVPVNAIEPPKISDNLIDEMDSSSDYSLDSPRVSDWGKQGVDLSKGFSGNTKEKQFTGTSSYATEIINQLGVETDDEQEFQSVF